MRTFLTALFVVALLQTSAAEAGSLAPTPRVVAKYDRNFIERSGAQTLQELLDTGIIRYFLTGGQSLLVLVNGRPYATTSSDLDSLPLSAVERIEILGGDSLGSIGGTLRGALNIVLRSDLDGFETRTVTRTPSRDGGDAWQGSVFWGGAIGKGGRMTLGVDVLDRQEIPGSRREHSRSSWRKGGSFSEAGNVSVGGNTVYVVQRDEEGNVTGVRSVALGECDRARGYTGPLSNPPGIRNGDKGCGFAFGNFWWDTPSHEQQSAIVNLDHPFGEDAELHLDVNVTQSNGAFRYAPSVDVFSIAPNQDLLDEINAAAGSAFEADDNDSFAVGHRFVSHGNRDWSWNTDEYDISLGIEGRLAEDLGYDARLHAWRWDAFLSGNTLVHAGRIREAVREGRYNLANPFSQDPDHLEAIRHSSLQEEMDAGAEALFARLALEGDGLEIGARNAAWTAGVELGRAESHSLLRFRSNDGMTHRVIDVLGSGGVSFAGERETAAAFAEMSLPVVDRLELRLAGRGAEYDDVGGLRSWRLGAEYRATDIVTLRSFWSAGESSPSMGDLYATEYQDHPYVQCDPGAGPPPRTCAASSPRQVTREVSGNPKLDPSESERLSVGAEARKGPFFLSAEWYRLSIARASGLNTATWAMLNLPECHDGGSDCIQRNGGDITIHQSYDNVSGSEISGINTRFGGGMRTSWGVVGMRGAWRHVLDAEARVAGVQERYVIARNAVRAGFLARRGNLTAIWTANYRSGFKNQDGSGEFKSWTGHDVSVDWADPLGLDGARVSAGVFNLTDKQLTTDTANPSATDGPVAAGWGRTFFLTVNMRF